MIQLDVIPIYKNEMFPEKGQWWHFEDKNLTNIPKQILIKQMIEKIKHIFFDCDFVIVIENGKVIEVLNG